MNIDTARIEFPEEDMLDEKTVKRELQKHSDDYVCAIQIISSEEDTYGNFELLKKGRWISTDHTNQYLPNNDEFEQKIIKIQKWIKNLH